MTKAETAQLQQAECSSAELTRDVFETTSQSPES